MRHFILSERLKFSSGTDAGYRFNFDMTYGRDVRDRIFLPVRGITPTQTVGRVLPADMFIITKKDGSFSVELGEDLSNRCLLFVGVEKGHAPQRAFTTGIMIAECSAGDNLNLVTEVIALLEVGQSVMFDTAGRELDFIWSYTWNGVEVECNCSPKRSYSPKR